MNRNTPPYDSTETTVPQSNASGTLEPTKPETAVNLYLDARQNAIATTTLESKKYRLSTFIEWCTEQEIENMNVLSGRKLYEFRIWKQNKGLAPITIRGHIGTVRTFIAFCERIDAVHSGLSDKVLLPQVDLDEQARDTFLDTDRANEIREHLRTYEYASRDHVIIELLWHCGMRVGGLHSLDTNDFKPRNKSLDMNHRPETDTPLKNKSQAERPISLSDTITEIVNDYVTHNRIKTADEYGREPLLTSKYGRLSKSVIGKTVYHVTQPCMIGPCPHGRTPSECEYRAYNHGSECPSSVRPHDVRRGSITNLKLQNVPNEVVEDRMDVGSDTLAKHYDARTPSEQMELRRKYLDELDL